MSDQLATEIAALVDRYVGFSTAMDFAAKKSMWDEDDPAPLLMPEEMPEALIGWPAIDAYWSKSRTVMSSLRTRAWGHRARSIAPEIVLATYTMRWVATLAAAPERKPIGADVRVTALLRRKPPGWRFFHVMEGPVDLLTMARLAAARVRA